MRQLKIAAALAAIALMALVGAGTAGAGELYKDTNWAFDDTQKVGAKILATSQAGTSVLLENTENKTIDTCTSSELELVIESAGTGSNPGLNPWGSYPKANFNGCSHNMQFISAGIWETKNITDTQNGLFIAYNMEITVNSPIFGMSCVYKSAGVSIGTLTGALSEKAIATLDINGVVSSGACGSARLTATYLITNPGTGLYMGV